MKDHTGDSARTMAAAPTTHAQHATAAAEGTEQHDAAHYTHDAPKEREFFDVIDDAAKTHDDGKPIARGKITDMFTAVIFRATDSDTVYTRKDGSKSRKIALVMVELNNSGVYIKGSIYARQGPRQPKPHAEFGFFGANNQICLAYDDPAAKVELDRWRAATADEYVKWIKKQPLTPGGTINLGADLDGTGITV